VIVTRKTPLQEPPVSLSMNANTIESEETFKGAHLSSVDPEKSVSGRVESLQSLLSSPRASNQVAAVTGEEKEIDNTHVSSPKNNCINISSSPEKGNLNNNLLKEQSILFPTLPKGPQLPSGFRSVPGIIPGLNKANDKEQTAK
jgi:hypothetical protein